MKVIVILLLFAAPSFNFLIKYLNYKNRNAPIPGNVQDIYDADTYQQRSAYDMENLRLGVIAGICRLLLMSVFLIFNLHSLLHSLISKYTAHATVQACFMLGIPALAGFVASIVFNAVGTFMIEAKYGFNKTTIKTFIGDTAKNLIFRVVTFCSALALFLYLYSLIGNKGFIVVFLALALLVVLATALSPYLMRISYQFTPLPEGPLMNKL
ncbi:MAG: hypothetical protein FWG10_01045 [Eubacteriaceae bacterium]|nr:hypothetical protein [Eubacteriaceae bacterium]